MASATYQEYAEKPLLVSIGEEWFAGPFSRQHVL
jgi:hypothetical protein